MAENPPDDIPSDIYDGLLQATLSALVTHGYSNLTVRDIGDEWDRSRQLITYYFGGKEALLTTLLEDVLVVAEETIDSPPVGDPYEQLTETIDLLVCGPESMNTEYWRFLTALYEIQAQAHHEPKYQTILDSATDSFIEELTDCIERGIRDGVFRDVDAEQFANAIDDQITGAHVKRIHLGRADATAQTRRFLHDVIVEDLLLVFCRR